MNSMKPGAILAALSLALYLQGAAAQDAVDPRETRFAVGDIRIEGLQRVSEGTVFNYLPVNIGDELSPSRVREALKALYGTGFFSDVELRRDGSTLVIAVKERPSIESFEIKGNKDIKTEELQKVLRNVGLTAGKTFDRSTLEQLQQELTDQYFSRGKYGVRVDTNVENLPDNRVRIKIDIKEGGRAKIRQISVVGNTKFKEKDIVGAFELKTPNWLSWYKQDDRYSRESLQGDLEKLRSYYQDRGYANMEIESATVSIAPEKDDMFITVSVHEGEVYTVSDVKLAGNTLVPEAELRRYLLVQPGQIYSQKLISTTQELIQARLGEDGYAFAKVDPVPKTDDEKRTVGLTFLVDPGKRVYVRHINFTDVTRTNDEVFRRQVRQLEGSWLSNIALDRSKQRIQRLTYIEKVEYEKNRVEGTDDLVDVDFKIKEGPSAQLQAGIGYSESSSFMLNGSYADANFLGSGERVAVELNTGRYAKVYSFSHTDPHRSIDELFRTTSLRYSDVTQFVSASSDFSSKTLALGLEYGYEITEYQTLRFGGSLQRAQLLTTSSGSALQAQQWVQNNGNPYSRLRHRRLRQHLRVLRQQVHALRAERGLVVEHAQSRSLPGSRHAPLALAGLHCARNVRRVLRGELRGGEIHSHLAALHGLAVAADRLRRGLRRHDRTAAFPPVLRRRPGHHPRLQGKSPGSQGQLRQPLWRQHAGGGARGDHSSRAAKMVHQCAREPVLRHRQRVLDRRQDPLLWPGRGHAGDLPLQL